MVIKIIEMVIWTMKKNGVFFNWYENSRLICLRVSLYILFIYLYASMWLYAINEI